MTGRRPTLDEVAARAGVSKATASKVLNDRPGVSAATRRRVGQVIHDLGYALSTAPARPSTRTVTAVFDSLSNLYALRVLEGAIGEAAANGVDLVTASGSVDPRTVAAKGHLGLLVVTAPVPAADLPLVAVDPPQAVDATVVSIGSHHWTGGLQATSHLLTLGHRRIAFVGGSPTNAGLRERFGGYREAHEAAGVPLDPALVSQEGIGSGERVAAALLSRPSRPTAIFATTDGDAFAAIRAAHRAGLRVPADVSVVGYDDTYATIPASIHLLTTVSTPMHDIGRLALRTLLDLAAGEEPVSRHIRLATRLIARETTAPPPPRP